MNADAEAIFYYHERSKHHPHRYARSPGAMDWANQPLPFRQYQGATVVNLPFLTTDPGAPHEDLYRRGRQAPRLLTPETVGAMLELSMGLSAWKAAGGTKWALRMNPSSGNLHPTEAHLVLPPAAGLAAGLYHYSPLLHALERRAKWPSEAVEAVFGPSSGTGFFVAFTSIFWREAWKYGERAYRYCNHDVGHATAAVAMAASLLGWRLHGTALAADADIRALLGFDRIQWPAHESEEVDVLCWIDTTGEQAPAPPVSDDMPRAVADLAFTGLPSPLSPEHQDWTIINDTAQAAEKPVSSGADTALPSPPPIYPVFDDRPAATIIRQRRSATAFTDHPAIPIDAFMAMLERTLPRDGMAPFDTGILSPAVNLFIFVHRVDGLNPGLYALMRCPEDETPLRQACRQTFEWSRVEAGFPLYRLVSGDFRADAIRISCHQEIAGFSAFSLGMIARFKQCIAPAPYRYRHLFWETGMIGQVLYLEAEAAGFRGTGIGCYFDDAMHHVLGIAGNAYQSLYHFTVGTPVEDARLTTLPAYHHLTGPSGRSRPHASGKDTGETSR